MSIMPGSFGLTGLPQAVQESYPGLGLRWTKIYGRRWSHVWGDGTVCSVLAGGYRSTSLGEWFLMSPVHTGAGVDPNGPGFKRLLEVVIDLSWIENILKDNNLKRWKS